MKISLNGKDWILTGRIHNQIKKTKSMELSINIDPIISPVPATIPGAVQQDLLNAGLIENPYYGRNSEHSEWVNNRDWQFQKTFILNEKIKECQRFILCFEGLDFCGEIFLNAKKISSFSNMFVPVKIDVTSGLDFEGENFLEVVFRRSPEVDPQYGYTSRTKIFKSRYNYFWDWAPRMIPVGIYDDVYIKAYNYAYISDFFPKAEGKSISSSFILNTLTGGSYKFEYEIFHKDNLVKKAEYNEILRAGERNIFHQIHFENVKYWAPNGIGEQPLYTVRLNVYENGCLCDNCEKTVGFKKIRFVQNDNSPENALPYTIEVNGERVFIKGSNWVPISMYYGTATREEYYNVIKRFKDMNCNLLRVWGGGILEKEDFYDICDQLGIMVWQEFPQSSSGIDNMPPSDDEAVLENLKEIAEHFVKKRRHHVSHVVWCGGNELLADDLTPVDFKNRNIVMLKDVVEKLDAGKYFLPTSPSGPSFQADEENFTKGIHHDVHGHWKYMGTESHYRYFNNDDSLLRSETGTPGAASYNSILKYADNLPLWEPVKENRYWGFPSTWWIIFDEMKEMFGEFKEKDIKKYVDSTRYLQAESLRYASEATLRRKGNASGFIVWMGNEPYPNRINTSVIEFDGQRPKPAYYMLKNAFANTFCSLTYDKVCYKEGECFKGSLFLHNELETNVNIEYKILDSAGNILQNEKFHNIINKGIIKVCDIDFNVADQSYDLFFVRLILDGEINNTYIFGVGEEKNFKALRNLPDTKVTIKQDGKKVTLKNNTNIPAVGLFLDTDDFSSISKNYLTLLANEEKSVDLENETKVSLDGYNLK